MELQNKNILSALLLASNDMIVPSTVRGDCSPRCLGVVETVANLLMFSWQHPSGSEKDLLDTLIEMISDIEIAGGIHGDVIWVLQPSGDRKVAITAVAGFSPAGDRGNEAAGIHFPNPVVGGIRDIDRAGSIHDNAQRYVFDDWNQQMRDHLQRHGVNVSPQQD